MPSLNLRRWAVPIVVALVSLVSVTVVYAASFVTPLTGPVWNNSGNTYTFTVCSNTNPSDNICMEYDVNNSNSFTAISCSFTSLDTCTGSGGSTGSTWTCVAPEVANATPFRYQFFRTNSGGCNNGSLFTGFSTFNTGPNAITLRSIQASPAAAAALPLAGVGVAAVSLAGAAVIWRRRR